MTTYTANYNLALPNFNFGPWHDEIHNNFRIIDAIIKTATGALTVDGFWVNSTAYAEGDNIIDASNNQLYRCLVAHTSAALGSFSAYRIANPTHWLLVSPGTVNRGVWAAAVDYAVNDLVYDEDEYVLAYALAAHTSAGANIRADIALGNWSVMFDFKAFVTAIDYYTKEEIDAFLDDKQDVNDPTFTVPLTGTSGAFSSTLQVAGNTSLQANVTIAGTLGVTGLTSLVNATVTGVVKVPNGTAAAPTYSFSSDGDTGIYKSANGVIDFSIETAHLLSIFATGVSINSVGLLLDPTGSANTGISLSKAGAGIFSAEAGQTPVRAKRPDDGNVAAFYRTTTNVGTISVTSSATAYNTSSDKRLKENLRDFMSGWYFDNIQVWEFDWKIGGKAFGVMAQDVYPVFPDAVLVGIDEEDTWQVDYSKFVPLLIREVQDLRKRVAELEGKK